VSQSFYTADLPSSVSAGSVRSKAFQLFLLNYSNNFNRINSNDIEAFKLASLFRKDRSHSSVVPLLIYSKHSDLNLPFEYSKQKDLSFILDNPNIKNNLERYFILPEFTAFYFDENKEMLLSQRLRTIEIAEKSFVESFNLTYVSICFPS
jgi:hypothetical protein